MTLLFFLSSPFRETCIVCHMVLLPYWPLVLILSGSSTTVVLTLSAFIDGIGIFGCRPFPRRSGHWRHVSA
jgi:hypothetical protein